tara:strand:+ start:10210 stop:10728 length:519 start_codon:yes stop_codon:yes gene_type:complete
MAKDLEDKLRKWGEDNIATAISIINKSGKSSSGKLANSLRFDIKRDAEDLILQVYEAPYGVFVRKGVKGSQSSSKAPNSPFKYTTKFPPKGAIDRWVVQKGLSGARNKKGQFIPRKSLTYLIRRKIFRFGIAPLDYFKTFEDSINLLTGIVTENQKQEILLLIESTLNDNRT